MSTTDQYWLVGVTGFIALELYLRDLQKDATFSCATRRWFRTHTRPGKIAFCVGYAAFSSWYLPHIIREMKRLDVGGTVGT